MSDHDALLAKVAAWHSEPAGDGAEETASLAVADRVPYPIAALGNLLGSAASAIADSVSAPPPIAAHAVLAVAAFAAQDKANVMMDGRAIPLSLFLLTVAESGDRKSACDKVASAPLNKWQRDKVSAHVQSLKEYRDASDLYETERKAVLTSNGKHAALQGLIAPEPPPEPIVICQEPTLEGLQKSFKLGQPSQALFTDEGGQFFGGHAMSPDNIQKTIAGLSKYWDGSPIIRTRATPGESAMMYDRRLSAHLQVQPIIASEVLGNPLLMGQGLLARFLIAEAATLAGTRLYKAINPMTHPAVVAFHERVTGLLAHVPATCEGGGLDLPTLGLSQEARNAWIDFYNNGERALAPGQALELVKPVVSKAGENAIRVAGIFAILEGTRDVTGEQMERACGLIAYYLQGALRSAQLSEASTLQRDTAEVLSWLKGRPGKRATIAEMQKQIVPIKHRKSVAHIRTLMAQLVAGKVARALAVNNRGEPGAWEIVV